MPTSAQWQRLRSEWAGLSYYQRFESAVAFVLTLIIGLIILVALYHLTISVIVGLLLGVLDPSDQRVLHTLFGEIMTLLIALEFNHTLQYVVTREQSIIQTKVVLLIALLALARKFIILDIHDMSADLMLGLAAITLVLGISYWLIRERDDRLTAQRPTKTGDCRAATMKTRVGKLFSSRIRNLESAIGLARSVYASSASS